MLSLLLLWRHQHWVRSIQLKSNHGDSNHPLGHDTLVNYDHHGCTIFICLIYHVFLPIWDRAAKKMASITAWENSKKAALEAELKMKEVRNYKHPIAAQRKQAYFNNNLELADLTRLDL